jgi:tetratricopeptide (TPR) repeat protein
MATSFSTGRAPRPEHPLARALFDARQCLDADPAQALGRLDALIDGESKIAEAHRLRALALHRLGRVEEAYAANMTALHMAAHDPDMRRAAVALQKGEIKVAEPILRKRLATAQTDVAAIRMLAEVASRTGHDQEALQLLAAALDLAPGYHGARIARSGLLLRAARYEEAIAELDRVNIEDPDNPAGANLRATAARQTGDYDKALALYRDLAARFPDKAELRLSLGHIFKTLGQASESIAAYREALTIDPDRGEAWWSIANLKTAAFDDADIVAMEEGLARDSLTDKHRAHIHFALGKALEDRADWAASFDHYARGNALRRAQVPHQADEIERHVDRVVATFTPALLADRAGAGYPSRDPIFILGLPRSGSTLIEQILASHPQVEGTMELQDLPAVARGEEIRSGKPPHEWVEAQAELPPERLAELGADYLRRTRIQRKTDRPFFIDKLPNNWMNAGFIHLILPHATIIDARRHPLDCGFSNFRQHFARGQGFSNDLADMGRYYADYVRMMAHMDAVLPGRVHRVIHEQLVADPEGQIRLLLDAIGLPFDPACLVFHDNDRPVRTASSEQVRQPINAAGIDRWRHYDPWLGPLKQALGPVLDAYPNAPI